MNALYYTLHGDKWDVFFCELCVFFASFAVKKDLTAKSAKNLQGAQSPISWRLHHNHKVHKGSVSKSHSPIYKEPQV